MSPAATRGGEVAAAIAGRVEGRPLVIMLDVDGTLAPIAPRPEDARVPEATRRAVAALSVVPGVHVALVSGRSADDSARMVNLPGLWVLGNHGMERRSPDGIVVPEPAAAAYEAVVAAAARSLEPLASATPGAFVENKRWTISFHYRLVDEADVPALVASARRVATETRLRLTEGKKLVELRPPIAIDKGTATVALAEELGAFHGAGNVLFAGDDRTDEDAFLALRERSPRAITVKVGDEPWQSSAEFRLDGPDDLRELLEQIAQTATRF